MEVGEQRRGLHRRPEGPDLLVQDVTQRAQAGPQVDDERLVPLDVDHEARGVPPVAPVPIPRARTRPPHAVKRDVHRRDVSLRRATTFCTHGTSATIVANGLDFACLTDGPADGPLALCLHGFPDTAHTWRYLLPELAAAGLPRRRALPARLRPDAGSRRRALPGGGAGPRRQRAARGVRRRPRRRHRRPRLGRAGHLRRRGPPAEPLAPRRHRRGPPDGLHRHDAPHLRAAAAQLVHVLLPLPAGRGGAAARRLLVHRPPLARLVTGLRRRLGRRPGQGVHRGSPSASSPPSATTAPCTTPRCRRPSWPRSRPRRCSPRRSRRCTSTGATTAACCSRRSGRPLDFLAEGSEMEIVDGTGHFLHLERPDVVNRRIVGFLTAPDRRVSLSRRTGSPPPDQPCEPLGHQRRPPPAAARAGSSAQPHAPARPGSGTPPRRSASSSRPLPWRSEPAKTPWRRAVGLSRHGSGAVAPLRRQAHWRRSGQRPQSGRDAVHTVAPRSNIAWLNSHESPVGHQTVAQPHRQRRRQGGAGHGAGQHPHGVGVDRRHVLAEGERAHGPRRVRPDAGERTQRRVFARHLAVVVADDRTWPPGAGSAPAGCSPRPDHWRTTSAGPHRRTGGGVGKARDEALVVRARPARPGSAGASPRRRGSATGPGCGARAGRDGAPPPTRARRAGSAGPGRPGAAGLSPRRRRRRAAGAPARPPSSRPSACAGSSRPPRRAG